MKNIRNLKHFANVNIDRFFPRCYDLNDIGDKEDFKDDFRCVRAQQILKQILIDLDLKLPQIRVRPRTVPLSARSSMTSEDGMMMMKMKLTLMLKLIIIMKMITALITMGKQRIRKLLLLLQKRKSGKRRKSSILALMSMMIEIFMKQYRNQN